MSKVLNYFKNEDGAAAAEYALILAIIGTAIAAAAILLGTNIAAAIDAAATAISNTTT